MDTTKPRPRFLPPNRMERVAGHESPTQKRKREKLFSYLNKRLRELDLIGEVRSIVLYDRASKAICCSGRTIDSGVLFAKLNLSIGEVAIKYPPTHRLNIGAEPQGHFVRLNQFAECDDDRWVALIDIVISEGELGEVIPF